MLFSGGTTGRPKAVVQSHRSYAFTTQAYGQRILGLGEDDVTLAVPKLYFGYAMGSNLFFPFSVGASACLFPEKATAESIFAAIARHRPTVLVNVPTMIQQMVSHPGAASRDLSSPAPGDLRRRGARRDPAPRAGTRRSASSCWTASAPPSSGTSSSPTARDECAPERSAKSYPDSRCGCATTKVAISPTARSASSGCAAARAPRATSGSRRRREQTFRGEWVVTGDLVSRDDDGFFTYQGRGDDVLKVAGKWFSPAEVEGCLLRHPAVVECAVVGVVDVERPASSHTPG